MGKSLLINRKVALFQEPIVIDKRLPKWRSENSNSLDNAAKVMSNSKSFTLTEDDLLVTPDDINGYFNVSREFNNLAGSTLGLGRRTEESGNAIIRFFNRLSDKMKRSRIKKSERAFDVVEFFSHVKLKADQTPAYIDRVNKYLNYLQYVDRCGQTALKEKLIANMVINKLESILFAAGKFKLITEEDILSFAKNSPRALCLDYINNYVRIIPIEVIEKKMEFDKLEVFDNYVVMHYDVDGNSTDKTTKEKKEEIRKAKDPIMFGVINGSKKLYYVADWIDEYCDLTLDKVIEILGKETVESKYLTDKIDV